MASNQKVTIVALDNWIKFPQLSGFEYELRRYDRTSPGEMAERIQDATVVCTSATPIAREAILGSHALKLIHCNGVGIDHVDQSAVRERGITLCHVPAQNTDSVSEHAFALYFALRRKVVEMHRVTMEAEVWPTTRAPQILFKHPPRTNAEETLVVVGYGAIGRNVEGTGRALGMEVLIAERKGSSTCRQGRTPFIQALQQGTVFIFVAPLDQSTRNMVGSAELDLLNPAAHIVNVGRGGIIDEDALANALREGKLAGAATDVYAEEPVTKETSPLLDPTIPNLILSPHIAWYSSKTIKGTVQTVKSNIEGFFIGHPQNVAIAGKGYT